MAVDIAVEKSAHIARLVYDPEGRTLVVKFKTGATDTYAGVPPNVFAQMAGAPSKGKYFHNVIKLHYRRIGHTGGTKQ